MATFVDTYFYLALLNPRDAAHEEVTAVAATLLGKLVTTESVLTEVGDALSAPSDRPRFLALIELLGAGPDVEIVTVTSELFRQGVELYRHRPDKGWSLTDCISFVVMQERGVRDALTADQHFAQAGFRL